MLGMVHVPKESRRQPAFRNARAPILFPRRGRLEPAEPAAIGDTPS